MGEVGYILIFVGVDHNLDNAVKAESLYINV